MNRSGTFDAWATAFPAELVHELILTVLEEWPKFVRPNRSLENRITHRFVGHLRQATRGKMPFGFYYRERIIDPNSDVESGEVNISVRAGVDPEVFFCFECKRLNVVYEVTRLPRRKTEDYVGSEGMGRFIVGKYDGGSDEAGMIGYVMDGDVEGARAALEASVCQAGRTLRLLAPKRLHPVSILPQDRRVWQTVHRVRRKRFTIYHLLLPL